MLPGITPSFDHPENGMTMPDMEAALRTARRLNEVIVFRSTGRWSLRWLERGYPSKNFHVKGKSSDWGPQAGFVPYDGIFSKVGADAAKAAAGSEANKKGEKEGFASPSPLRLTRAEIDMQLTEKADGRTALQSVESLATSAHLVLTARRSKDNKVFTFIAKKDGQEYEILALNPDAKVPNAFVLADQITTGKLNAQPLMVMVSEELGANRKPMTGDYDLMAICPLHANYMSRSTAEYSKPALQLNPAVAHKSHALHGQTFAAGTPLDKVLDMRLNTGTTAKLKKEDPNNRWEEHADMGNLTPRILRCINMLNVEMGAVGPKAALRRVHHNAESHRHANFGALKSRDMEADNDGFPLTAFHPKPVGRYGEVCTIENMAEFREYAADLNSAGYFVPKNWTWNMSIRDRADKEFGHLLRR
jgi:hypothetical protein